MPQLNGGPLDGHPSQRKSDTLVIKLPVGAKTWRWVVYERFTNSGGDWTYIESLTDFNHRKEASYTLIEGEHRHYLNLEDEKGHKSTKTVWLCVDL